MGCTFLRQLTHLDAVKLVVVVRRVGLVERSIVDYARVVNVDLVIRKLEVLVDGDVEALLLLGLLAVGSVLARDLVGRVLELA